MENVVRGVSIHVSGEGLLYYVHYSLGTVEVSENEYHLAVLNLKQSPIIKEKVNQ
jgi:hypothetical protein